MNNLRYENIPKKRCDSSRGEQETVSEKMIQNEETTRERATDFQTHCKVLSVTSHKSHNICKF